MGGRDVDEWNPFWGVRDGVQPRQGSARPLRTKWAKQAVTCRGLFRSRSPSQGRAIRCAHGRDQPPSVGYAVGLI